MTLSIWVPVAYIGALVVSLSLFSSVYRKRTARKAAEGSQEPWHPEGHPERDVYQSLVSAAAAGTQLPDHLLKAALLNRAMTDVKRIVQMRDDKQALGVLLQRGSIGDETLSRFALAEKELEAEILDVVAEANTFKEGWGQLIFPTASEMVTHKKLKESYFSIPEERNKHIALLKAQGRPIPKPTIELPPLFTPPGTQVKVHSQNAQSAAAGQAVLGAGPGGLPVNLPPAQLQQLIQAQRAAKGQLQPQPQPQQVHGPPRPPTGPSVATGAATGKTNGSGSSTPVKTGGGAPSAPGVTAPLTPSAKGNHTSTSNSNSNGQGNGGTEIETASGAEAGPDDDGSSWATLSTPATPATAGHPTTSTPAAAGEESFDSTLDEEDGDDDDDGSSGDGEAGAAAAGGAAGLGTASPGANRAQRRQNKKKKGKKGGKK